MKHEELKTAVRKEYAGIALGSKSGCCGGSTSIDCQSLQLGYSQADLDTIPEGSNLGLGCGNPFKAIQIEKGWTVLDLGSGAGFDCFLASGFVGKDGKVIGVDMTPEMIEKARRNAEKADIDNVEFRLGEIEHLPVGDNSVDLIISNCVINLSTDKEAVFREAFRVLKKGGKLALSDIISRSPIHESYRKDPALYAGCVSGAVTEETYLSAIETAGFIDGKVMAKHESADGILNVLPENASGIDVFSALITAEKP